MRYMPSPNTPRDRVESTNARSAAPTDAVRRVDGSVSRVSEAAETLVSGPRFPEAKNVAWQVSDILAAHAVRPRNLPSWTKSVTASAHKIIPALEALRQREGLEFHVLRASIQEILKGACIMSTEKYGTLADIFARDLLGTISILEEVEGRETSRGTDRQRVPITREMFYGTEQGILLENVELILERHFGSSTPSENRVLMDVDANDGAATRRLSRLFGTRMMTHPFKKNAAERMESDECTLTEASREDLLSMTQEEREQVLSDAIVFSHGYRMDAKGVSLELAKWAHGMLKPGGICVIPFHDIERTLGSYAQLSYFSGAPDITDPEAIRLELEREGIQVRVLRPTLNIQSHDTMSATLVPQLAMHMFPEGVPVNRAKVAEYCGTIARLHRPMVYRLYLMAVYKDKAPRPQASWTGERVKRATVAQITEAGNYGLLPPRKTSAPAQSMEKIAPIVRMSLKTVSPEIALQTLDSFAHRCNGIMDGPIFEECLRAAGITLAEFRKLQEHKNRIERQRTQGLPVIDIAIERKDKDSTTPHRERTPAPVPRFTPLQPSWLRSRTDTPDVDTEEDPEPDEDNDAPDDSAFEEMEAGGGRRKPGRPLGSKNKPVPASDEMLHAILDAIDAHSPPTANPTHPPVADTVASRAETATPSLDTPAVLSADTLARIDALEAQMASFGERFRTLQNSLAQESV